MDIELYKEMMPRFNAIREMIAAPYKSDLGTGEIVARCKRVVEELPAAIAWLEERGVEVDYEAGNYVVSCGEMVRDEEKADDHTLFNGMEFTWKGLEAAVTMAELGVARRLLGIEA